MPNHVEQTMRSLLTSVLILSMFAACAEPSTPVRPKAEREPKTFRLSPGQTLTLRSDQVVQDDRFICRDKEGSNKGGVNGVPTAGTGVGNSAGMSVETHLDGTVVATCEPGPAGNV